ncbi:cobalamin-binding protein [Sediminicurvatus halobius]|uniref:Cobalamin-binding protein n=1 Tax=Sediminicurvatus halobius TaxID=2182432 RepID=A0A2U2N211_9GAMM|nr:cobalamin-binding protein [Spiribacter halobius]PWG63140.1 cobalamin-binding protein [Spiribacter halobius]UEX77590.1 cobalamin-binding protein [Spiribacter halobius]
MRWAWLALLCWPLLAAAAVEVVDDAGQRLQLPAPAQRVISLAPHATELLFAVGAGEQVVGAVSHSDYPPAAREVPRVGGYDAVDLERIVALDPDLVVAWGSGNGTRTIQRLRELEVPVYVSEPRTLADIAAALERLGTLTGHGERGHERAEVFRARWDALRRRYAGAEPVTVLYQIWNRPLMTVNGEHLISDIIRLCGGRNAFAEADALAPSITREAVLGADPEAIVASGMGASRPEWLDDWRQWPGLRAVREGHLYHVHPDLLQRHGPRILDGAERLCRHLQRVREVQP